MYDQEEAGTGYEVELNCIPCGVCQVVRQLNVTCDWSVVAGGYVRFTTATPFAPRPGPCAASASSTNSSRLMPTMGVPLFVATGNFVPTAARSPCPLCAMFPCQPLHTMVYPRRRRSALPCWPASKEAPAPLKAPVATLLPRLTTS